MTPEELQILKDLAAESKASRTPEQRLPDEMTEHFGALAWATAMRLSDEFAKDGWRVESVLNRIDGHCDICLWRIDLHEAAVQAHEVKQTQK